MTDIEVGSLWNLHGIWRVVALSKNYVFFEALDGHDANFWEIEYFVRNAKPYTPPKEYKVWVYEHKSGDKHILDHRHHGYENSGYELKAILTGKEGDGL